MPRPTKSDEDVRKTNASLRAMLSEVRGELRDAEVALEAILNTIEGTDHDEKARAAAEEAVEKDRAARAARGRIYPADTGEHPRGCECADCGSRERGAAERAARTPDQEKGEAQ